MNASFEAVPFPKLESVTFRELRPAETDKLMPFLKKQGWGIPYPFMSAALVGEYQGEIIAFAVLQMLPMVGPIWVQTEWRGSGLAALLVREFEKRVAAGQVIAVADNPFSERLCEMMGMREIPGKLYVRE